MSFRKEMIGALKTKIIPELRKRGFKGSFPHFKRIGNDKIDILAFQFNKNGGSFIVEISVAYPNRAECGNFFLLDGETIDQLNIGNTHVRYRLGSKGHTDGDCWIAFDENHIGEAAGKVAELLPSADQWWDNPPITEALKRRKRQGLRT